MIKIFLSLIFLLSVSFAGLVNAVSIKVEDKVITLYDIDEAMQNQNLSKKAASEFLIEKTLFEDEIQKNNITVDIFDVNDHIEKLAQANGMELYAFKAVIKQQFKDQEKFEQKIKDEILKQKLMQSLLRGNLKVANEEDLKIYYENNKNTFQTSVSTTVTQYASKNKKDLLNIKKNPMLNPVGLKRADTTLENKKLNPQLKYVVNETKIGEYTPIFTASKHFVMFYIKEKIGNTVQEFEAVKNTIFSKIMKQREQKFLSDYFKKKRITANIEIIR